MARKKKSEPTGHLEARVPVVQAKVHVVIGSVVWRLGRFRYERAEADVSAMLEGGDSVLFVARKGQPIRSVYLKDLVAAILQAEPKEVSR